VAADRTLERYAWPVDRAHQLSEEIEERIRSLVPHAITLSHIEPISQPASYDDIKLERW
jgi:divalent metal cation (Fe/Co/Zn/Cd) transporter